MPRLIVTWLAAFATSLLFGAICRTLALRYGYVVQPSHDRWHRRPTPVFGGVAIAATVFTLVATGTVASPAWILLCGTGAAFLLGFVDDLITLKPYSKLVAEIAIASAFVFWGYRLNWTESLTLDALLTLVWIVGLTNAFNLLDNMDGLSAGTALIAGFMLLANHLTGSSVTPDMQLFAALLGATAGFLVYNFHPATMFLGDSGSLFIGLNLAVFPLTSTAGGDATSNVLSIIAAPVLILLIPIADTALVTVSRLVSGRSAVDGGRDHSSHRLVAIGLSERAAVAVLWTLAALSGLLAFAIRNVQDGWMGVVTALFLIGTIIFTVYLAQVRVYETSSLERLQRGGFTPFALELMHKRRIAEVLLDLCLVSIAYYSAYRLRFEGHEWGLAFPSFISSLPLVLGVQMAALFVVGAYRGVWRHFCLMDAVVIIRGVALGMLVSVAAVFYLFAFANYSAAVFVIYGALATLLLSGSRASFRLIGEFVLRRRHTGQRLVIYGAGYGGAMAIRELLNGGSTGYRMLGFADDDPRKSRARIQGYPILGGLDALESLIKGGAVDAVVISTGLIDVARLEKLQQVCSQHGVTLSRIRFEVHDLVAVS